MDGLRQSRVKNMNPFERADDRLGGLIGQASFLRRLISSPEGPLAVAFGEAKAHQTVPRIHAKPETRAWLVMTRLLIIKPSSLGDIVHGLQVAASLRAQVPDLRIGWVARDVFAPLVERAEPVAEVHVFERRGGAAAFLRLLRKLRRTPHDVVFDFQGLFRSALMTGASTARLKAGRSDAREGARWAYHRRVPLPPSGRASHALDILLRFCPVLGAEPRLAAPLLFRPGVPFSLPFLAPGPAPFILFPESRRPEKCWPHFAELTRRLLRERPERRVVWAGSTRSRAEEGWPPERFANLTGRTPVETLPDLLRGAALVVGNDSGPLHLAAAMEVPVLAIFGPTDPRRFGPYPVGAPGRDVITAPRGELRRLEAEVVAKRIMELISHRTDRSDPSDRTDLPAR